MEQIIQVKDLSFEYTNREDQPDLLALDGVNLEIEQGSFVAVLGHNGSGKSTLAKHINAILLPTRGQVRVAGMDTREEDKLFDIREKAGMVFQNPDNQIVATVVEEDVAFAPENLGLPSQEIRRRVDEALKAVGMENFKRSAPHMLSGGQKQRVAIAGVLAMEPKVLILDEPTAGLDPRGRDAILETIRTINKARGTTIILVSHSMDEVARSVDRLYVVNDGRLPFAGTPGEVFIHGDELRQIGLNVPQVTQIAQALNHLGVPMDPAVYTMEDAVRSVLALRGKGGGASC